MWITEIMHTDFRRPGAYKCDRQLLANLPLDNHLRTQEASDEERCKPTKWRYSRARQISPEHDAHANKWNNSRAKQNEQKKRAE